MPIIINIKRQFNFLNKWVIMPVLIIFFNFRNKIANILDYCADFFSQFRYTVHLTLVFLILILFIFPGMNSIPPLDRDEARFAQASRQMLEDQDFVVIKFQEELRSKKPIGIYWIQSISASILNKDNIFSYRLPNLIGGLLTCGLTGFFIFNILFYFASFTLSKAINLALLSSIFLSICLGFSIEVRQAKTDTVLLLICLIQQWFLWKIYVYGKLDWNIYEKHNLVGAVRLFWVFMGLGLLVKGPIAPLLAFLTILGVVVLDRIVEKKWTLKWLSVFLWVQGIIIILIINLPWLVLVWKATNGVLIFDAMNQDLFEKIKSGQENHGAPPGSHILALFFTFWPLTLLLPFAFRACIDWQHQIIIRFLMSWIVPFWIVMELVPTKLPHYILPVFPAMIALSILGLTSPASGKKIFKLLGNSYQILACFMTFLLLIIIIFFSVIFSSEFINVFISILIGLGLIFSILMGYIFLSDVCRYKFAPLYAMALFAGISHSMTFGILIPNLDKIHISPRIQLEISNLEIYPEVIVSAGYNEPSLVFLLGRDILLINPEEAALVLTEGKNVLALIESKVLDEFKITLNKLGHSALEIGNVSGYNLARGQQSSVGMYKLKLN